MISEAAYKTYLDNLLAGDRNVCLATVESLLEQEIPLLDLYEQLFQRSMYDVGTLWENNRISVAVEHLATAITERLLAVVYPRLFRDEHNGRRAIIACVPHERHQIGARMVADAFELSGWDGYFLGADTPQEALVRLVREKQPDMVALSSSLASNLDRVRDVLDRLRREFSGLPLIVGGQAFTGRYEEIERAYPGVRYVPTLDALRQQIAGK